MEEQECLSQKTNGSAHLYGDSNYAHFSQITEANKHRFPSLSNASPILVTLESGDALYIPAKWWHWVKSYGERCISINYWFSHSLSDHPHFYSGLVGGWPARQKWTNRFLIETSERCNPDGIWLWRDQFAYRERISMREFIDLYSNQSNEDNNNNTNNTNNTNNNKKKKEFAYLITLSDYECKLSSKNRSILDELSRDITFPFANSVADYGSNFWMNFGGIDTGLHYDDEDGLLCVVDGTKEVTLYPPSDSVYLAPYPVDPIKLIPNNRCFMYNLYKDLGPLPSESVVDSSTFLEVSLQKAPALATYARKLQDRFGVGKIVYGIKNRDGVIQWEFYFYGIDRFCTTYQDSKSLFTDPTYNADLTLETYLKFHQDTLGTGERDQIPKAFMTQTMENVVVYSIDFDEESVMDGQISKLNIYKVITSQIQIPFILSEHTLLADGESTINSVQHIDLFTSSFESIPELVKRCLTVGMKAEDIENLANFCNGSPYKCTTVSLVNKREEIGIYFFGISYESFVNFLVKYRYPPDLLDLTLKNAASVASLQLEVGFHFLKGSTTATPSRTAFYGLF